MIERFNCKKKESMTSIKAWSLLSHLADGIVTNRTELERWIRAISNDVAINHGDKSLPNDRLSMLSLVGASKMG